MINKMISPLTDTLKATAQKFQTYIPTTVFANDAILSTDFFEKANEAADYIESCNVSGRFAIDDPVLNGHLEFLDNAKNVFDALAAIQTLAGKHFKDKAADAVTIDHQKHEINNLFQALVGSMDTLAATIKRTQRVQALVGSQTGGLTP